MKKSNRLLSLIVSLAAPAIAAWILAGCEFSPEMIFGTYTLAGLFFLTTADYLPPRRLTCRQVGQRPVNRWIKASMGRTNKRLTRTTEVPA